MPADPGSEAPLGGNPRFLRIFLAGIAAQSGRTIAFVAIPWLVFTRTGSALDVAYVGIAELVATISVSLPAGVWVDRYDRRRLMILSDVLRGIATALFALVLWRAGFSLLPVGLLAFATGGLSVLFNPARQALLPRIVGVGRLATANGLIASSESLTGSVAGAIAGGLLLAVGAALALAYTSLAFFVSAALVALVVLPPPRTVPGRAPPRRRMGREIVEGFKWLYGARGLFELSVSALPMNFFSSLATVFLVVFATVALHGNAFTFGLLVAAMSLGGATGALLVGRTHALRHAGKAWVVGYGLVGGSALTLFALVPAVTLALPLLFLFAAAAAFAGTTWLSTAQAIVPSEMQGRYFAVDGLISWVVLPVAEIAGALLIGAFGVGPTFLAAGLGLVATGAVGSFARPLWRLTGEVAASPNGPTGT